MRSYNPLSVEDIPMDKMSATHSQFRPPPSNPLSDPLMSAPAAGAIARDAEDHRIYLKASHFEIGTDEDAAVAEGRRQSTTMRHFVNPQSLAHTVRREGAGASGLNGSHTISRRNERFEETLDNTITRYPGSNERLTMTSNSRYGQFAQPKRTVPHRPPAQDTMSAYLHPAVVPSVEQQDGSVRFEPIRDFSTVSRRTFVAPEVVIAQAS
nr:hypothetical protein HK105_006608 [Polyrhizophydium stewartii]